MDTNQAYGVLFAIATETRRSFESPVILVTMKDYAESIFSSLLSVWSALVQTHKPSRLIDIIGAFHLEWLQAVNDIETFKKRTRNTPREHISHIIDYSIECANRRSENFQKFVEESSQTISPEKRKVMQNELDLLFQMHDNLISSLRDKQITFSALVDPTEYNLKVLDETEELLNWLDYLNENLAIQFSQIIGLKPELTKDLTKILREIIDDAVTSANPETQLITQKLENERKSLFDSVGKENAKDSEIKTILAKIKNLEVRIEQLKYGDSSAVMALRHKTIYLGDRIQSIENLRTSLLVLKNKTSSNEMLGAVHIFDHLLPPQQRCRLVEGLVKAWTNAISGRQHQEATSIISILSITDMKGMISEENMTHTIDKYGRKIYTGDEGCLYQLNEKNKLVRLSDDEKHVYFYDECGRYYYNEQNERIYKAQERASEYCIKNEGNLLKLKEIRNGREYFYDRLGRYMLDDKGERIYCGESGKFYENDGMGNLVRMKSYEYIECPHEPKVSEDSVYLKRVVGEALKKCIAQVVLCQPTDPVKFLAERLVNYQICEQRREAKLTDELALVAEREARILDTHESHEASTAPASDSSGISSGERELSYADPEFVNYQNVNDEKLLF